MRIFYSIAALLIASISLHAQVINLEESDRYVDTDSMRTVTGRVVTQADNVNEEDFLTGVSVVVKGTYLGTTSDVNGNYAILCKGPDVLVFRFLGMQTRT